MPHPFLRNRSDTYDSPCIVVSHTMILSKKSITKKCDPKLIFINEKNEKDSDDF
jgi:hypothetical protein